MQRETSTLFAVVLCLTSVLVFCGTLTAQESSIPLPGEATPVEPNWGTTAASVYVAHALDFDWFFGTTAAIQTGPVDRYCTGAAGSSCGYVAGLHLPAGALITAFGVDACDHSTTHEVRFNLFSRPTTGGIVSVGGWRTTSDADALGCMSYVVTLPSPVTVDNQNNSYWADVLVDSTVSGSPATSFGAYRVYYKLQVSTAPAVATFPNDVPTTHPFFRFVEALAAAGLTAGCGPGSFCPDAPVTRGQIAVFLAAALGLHFPN